MWKRILQALRETLQGILKEKPAQKPETKSEPREPREPKQEYQEYREPDLSWREKQKRYRDYDEDTGNGFEGGFDLGEEEMY